MRYSFIAIVRNISASVLFMTPGCDGAIKVRTEATPVVVALCDALARCEPTLGKSFASAESCLSSVSECRDGNFWVSSSQSVVNSCIRSLESTRCEDLPRFWRWAEVRSVSFLGSLRGLDGCPGLNPLKGRATIYAGLGEQCRESHRYGIETEFPDCGEFDSYCDDNICIAARQLGEACDWEGDSDFCGESLSCWSGNQPSVCILSSEAASPSLALGEECSTGWGCPGLAQCLDGICTNQITDLGSSCGEDARCPYGSLCIEGTCVKYALCQADGGVGEPCYKRGCKHDSYCDQSSQKCRAYLSTGKVCGYSGAGRCSPMQRCREGKCG